MVVCRSGYNDFRRANPRDDVGAKFEIYTIMNELVKQGMSIIMISSELLEVIGMSDRIYVVSEGRIAGEVSGSEATEEKIMTIAV